MPHDTTKTLPLSALRFAADLEMGDNGEGAKSVPVKLHARSGQPVNHWYFGRIVHDMSGMKLSKQKMPIDYCHSEYEVLGYANKFDTATSELTASGALTPFNAEDRASEVIFKSRQGVPYEASIYFDPSDLLLEYVPEGFTAPVNGYNFAGPGYIAREWMLRGLAVCPYGQDGNTAVEFSKSENREVTVKLKETMMSAQPAAVEAAPVEAVEAKEADKDKEVVPAVEAAAPAESPAVETAAVEVAAAATPATPVEPAATAMSQGQKFLTAFGDKGGVWFAQGKTFEEAQGLFTQDLRTENDRLRAELTKLSANRGEAEPVSFSAAPEAGEEAKPDPKKFAHLGGIGKFAANIKFKKS